MDELRKYYDYLKGAGADVPNTFESFSNTLQEEESAKEYYKYLVGAGFDAPSTFDSFSNTLLKKKEPTKQEVGQEVGVSVEEPTPSPSVSQEQVEEAPASALDQLKPLSQIFEAPMFTDPVERAGGAIESPEIDILSDEDEEMLKSEKPYGFEKYITGAYEDPKEDLKAKRNALIKHQKETEEKYAAYPEEERMQLMSETQADYGEIFLNYLDKTDPNNSRRLREQRESDIDFYSDTDKITLPFVPRQSVEVLEESGMIPKILPEVKRISPANQIRLNGLQLVMDVKQDNLDSSVKAFDDKYGNEFTALTDKLQGMQNLISGNTFNGTEDQYNEYMNGVNRLKELESTPEYLGYQQSFDEYKLFEEEYKKDSVVREADLAALEAYSYQLKKDEEYKESGLLGRSFINASDITKGAVMRLFQSAATLPKILMPDNEYALSDGLKDYVDNVAKVYNERNPKPSAFTKEGLTSSIANVNGYEVEIDGDEPTGRVFDKDGYLLPRKTVAGYTTFSDTDDVFAEDIVKVYESNKDEYDIEETINIASNLYTAGEVTADMFVTLAPISRAVTLTTKAGTASKAAKLLRIGEVSEKTAGNFGTFTGVMVQSSNGFYDAAIEAGASEAEASAFSAFQSAIIGTIALLNPVESKAIANMFTGQSSKEYAKKYVSEILKGKTRSEAMKSVVSNVVKKAGQLNYEMFKEGIEEITEIPAGQFGDYLFDLGTTTPGEIQDYIDTFAVAYLASGPMSLISLRGNNPNMSTMLYSAMGDMEYVENLLKKNINKEVRLADGGKKLITEEFVQEQMDRLNRIKTVSEPYLQNEALTEDEKKLVVSLVNKRQALSETLKNADDVVGKKSKQEIEAINTQLERFLDKKDGSPFYLVEGKAISKEELDEKIADENWVKGFKEGRWAVHITNDQDAINRLKEATEGKPVVEAEVEAEVEEAPVEEQVSVNKGDKIQFSSDGQVFDGVVTRQTEDGVYIESDVSGEETLIPTNKVIATADMGIVAGDNVFIETDAGPILGEVKSVTDTEVEIDNPDIPGETITIDRSKARKIKEGDEVQYNVAGELETFKVKRVEGDQVVVENPDIPGGEISLSAGEVTLKDPFKRVEDDTQVAEQERVDTEEQGREEDTGQVQEPEVSEEEGAADTVLQENQEVEATDSSVNELIDELNATDPKTVPPSKTREMVKVARNVKKALNTLSKLLPDVKIVVHKTSEGYVSSAEGRFSGEGGEYNPDTKTIHINLEKATPTTVAHEVFHAVLIESLGTVDTQETTDEMYERILKSAKLSNEVRTKIEEHKAKYPEGIQSEEALAELTGILASEYSSLSLTAKGAVKSWVNKLSRAVGLGNMFDQVARDKEVIDLLNVLSGKLSRGEVLEEADVKEISRRKKPTEKKSEKKPESKKKPKKEEKKPSERVSRQDRRLVERAAEKAKMAVEDFVFAVASGTYDVSEKVSKVVDKLIKQRVIDIVNSIQSAGLSNESKEKLRKLIPSINKEDIKSIMSDVYEMLPKPKIDKISQLAKRRGKSVVDFLYDSVKNFDNLTQSVYEAVNPFLNKLYKAIALTAMLNVSISYGTDFTGAIDSLIAKIPVKEIAVNMTKVATSVNAVDSAITDLVVDGAFGEYNTTIERLMVKAGSESMVTKADESFETKVKDDAEIKKEQEAVKKELERLEQAKSDSAAIAVNNEILEKNTHYNSDNRYEKTLHAFDNQYPNLDKFGNYIGQIVGVLPPKSARQERGINSVDGIGMIQHNLDGDVYTGVYMDANNSLHRTSKTAITDSKGDTYGYVQVYEFLEGSNGERARVVYKKYSEVPDSELKNTTPFRQFLYKDIDFSKKYDAQGFKGKDKDGNRTVGSIGLKNGKKNPYYIGNKEVINKDAVDINFAKKAPSAYGSFSGTAVTFIFKDKAGNQYVSEFAGSVPAIKEHGDNLMKIYGDQDMVIGYHDVGSFNYKTKGVDGKINTTRIDRMNKDVSLKDLSGGGKAQLQDYAGSGTYKLLPSEQEALEKANPVRQNVRKQIIGRNAKLSSEVRNNLLRARSMESRRKNKKDIKIQTGWERGKDNKWRYEIPDDIPYFKSVTKAISDVLLGKRKADSFGIINENGKLTISGKLAFPGNILDAYPELENYDVSFNKWINEGEGEMSALFETIDVGIGEVNTAEDIEESMSKAIPVLIHEIQHAIQRIEDFGRGGNKEIGEELLKSKFPKAKELYEQLVSDRNFVESVIDEHRNLPQGKELVTAIKQAFLEQSIVDFEEGGAKLFQVADKIHNSPKFKKVAGMIGLKRGKETIQGIEKILSDSRELTGSMDPSSLMNVISQINFEISKISDPKTPFETYQRIAGEVEARNVMERMEMSEELRAETTLEETEDVAREDQIVIGVARPLVLAKKARTPKKPPLKKAPPKKISDIRKQKVDSGEYLIAPNGRRSNLPKKQYDLVRTKEFKDWFGDWENDPENASKVVDENGEPLVVYHGSPAIDIEEFDRSKSSKFQSVREYGTYFSTNKVLSELYANQKISSKGKVYPVFLKLNDLVDFEANGEINVEAWENLEADLGYKKATGRPAMEAYAGKNSMRPEMRVDGIKANNVIDMFPSEIAFMSPKEYKKTDAYEKVRRKYLGDAYLVFDHVSNAIKLADGTNVTFDKSNNIRKQKVDDDKKAYEDGSKELNQKVKKKEDAQRSYSDRKIVPLIRTLRKRFFDFQGFTKSMLRKAELGRIADRLTNAKGAGGRAKAIFKEYYDKIYDGLSVSERKHLDNLITYRRIVSANEARIRSNAEAEIEFEKVSQEIKDLKAKSKLTKDEKAELKKLESKKKDLKKKKDRGEIMTGSIGLDDAKAAIRGLESIVGSEVFEKINGRANEYFGAFDEMLDKDLKDGLVTQEQYDAMKGIDYSPRVWMTYIYDLEGDAVLMRDALDRLKKKFSLSEANYQTLKDGLKNDDPNMLGTLMMDSEILLSTYLNTREKKRSFNNLNQEMAKELAKLIPEFEELSAKKDLTKEEKKRLKYLKQVNDSFSLTPRTGFREMFYYSEGKREKFYVKDEIYDEWYDNKKGVLDKSIESGISKWTGVKLLKAAATGANPLFAITNFPRDFFQVLLFSNAYSNILPKSMAQLTVDFFKSWAMIHKDSKEFKEFVKYGGMMDFLYTDGRVDQGAGMKSKIKDFIASTKVGDKGYYKGAKLFEKAADLASYLNMISEIGFRLSVYNKVLSNEMKKLDKDRKGMTPEEIMMAEEDARYRAAAAARELIDFSIGGDVIKGADPYLPYINAAAQGTYTALRYSYENPAAISIKTLQATGLVSTGIMLLGSALVGANRDDDDENSVKEIMTKTYNGVSPHIRKNYFIIPLGTKDEKGDYKYFKIAKNQSLSPFFVLTESIMESFYLDNKESNKNLGFRMLDSFSSSFMPLDINPYTPEGEMEGFNVVGNTFSKNPVFGGILEWSTGYNFFRNEPLSRDAYSTKIGSDAWNNFSDSRTEEFYKDFAQFMDENGVPAASPAKIKNSVERLITSPYTNPFTNALYVTLESQTDYAKSFNKQSVIEDVTKSIMKGFAGEKRLIGSANYKPEDSKLNKSQKESIDKKISDINKGKAIAKTYGRRIGKELSMDQEFINASNKDKMKIAQGKFDQVVDFASRKGIELEPKEMEMLQRKFMSQVNIRNRDIELYKFYDVMYETDPRIQALTWINEFGYLDPKSDDYKELMIEYKNTYKKTMGKNVSDKFFQNIGRYYKEEGMN